MVNRNPNIRWTNETKIKLYQNDGENKNGAGAEQLMTQSTHIICKTRRRQCDGGLWRWDTSVYWWGEPSELEVFRDEREQRNDHGNKEGEQELNLHQRNDSRSTDTTNKKHWVNVPGPWQPEHTLHIAGHCPCAICAPRHCCVSWNMSLLLISF